MRIFVHFSSPSELQIETCKLVYWEKRCSHPVPVSPWNTNWKTGTRGATVMACLSLPARLLCSPNLQHSARLCSTSTRPRWIWKTVTLFSASTRSELQTEFWHIVYFWQGKRAAVFKCHCREKYTWKKIQWKAVSSSMIKDFPTEHFTSVINQILILCLSISRIYLIKCWLKVRLWFRGG